jgi:hypothetical protein
VGLVPLPNCKFAKPSFWYYLHQKVKSTNGNLASTGIEFSGRFMKIHELVDKLLADIVNVLQLTRRLESSNIFSGCQLKGFRRKARRAHDYIYFSSIHANNEIRIESICYLASGELNSRHPKFSRTNIRYFPPPVSSFYVRGRAMPHAVLRRPLTA